MSPSSDESALQPVWDWMLGLLGSSFFEFPMHFLPVVVAVVSLTGVFFTVLDCHVYRKLPARRGWLDGLKTMSGYVAAAGGLYWLHLQTGWFVLEVPPEAPRLGVFLVEVAAFMVVGEFLTYWWHRLEHGSAFVFENVHHVHHRTHGPLTIWTNFVVHPVEGFVVMVCLYAPPLIFGAHPLVITAYAMANTTAMVMTHAGYYPRFYPSWLLPPAYEHELHHSEKRPTNLSVVMTYGDKLFGTYKERLPTAD